MSVIGKMYVSDISPFSDGVRVKLSAQCVDALMAHYHPENEDVVFTKYSPSADVTLQFPIGFDKFEKSGSSADPETGKMYFVYQKQVKRPSIQGAVFFMALRVASSTDYGGTSKMVELCNRYTSKDYIFNAREAHQGNFKLGIDNPFASDQFIPGEESWWVVGYRSDELTQDAALGLARA